VDPISAMAFSLIVSWVVVNAAWEAGVDQAKAESRHAAEAIRRDLQKRHKAWAKQLERRLADGRKGGPATAIWWGWAAMRTAKGLRRMVRREPRAAEKAIGGTTGPFSRIFGAAWRGAQYARDEARRQREAHEKRSPREPVGVCGRCGAVAAKAALVWALTRFGRQEQMCAKCRAAVEAEREVDQENAAATSQPDPDIADADVVDVPIAALSQPEPEDVPHERPADDSSTAPTPEPPTPAAARVTVDRVYNAPTPQRPVAVEAEERPALNTTPEGEGMPRQLIPAKGGALATRHTAMTRRGGGDSYTHGQWNRATADIHRRLEMLPALLEQMLGSLNHADAGRTQVAGVMAFHADAIRLITEVTAMLVTVNRQEMPVVEAVTTAGGPDEIPNISYFREV
jgi:hypothetical protein